MDASKAIAETAEDLEGSEFTHDPEATRYGIVQSEYDRYRAGAGLSEQSVELIEQSEYEAIYRHRYWEPLKCADMPDGVDFVLFQMGVNIGVFRASEILQAQVGATVDGAIGPKTIAAAKSMGPTLIELLLDAQAQYYNQITYDAQGSLKPHPVKDKDGKILKYITYDIYIEGWKNRIGKVKLFLATGLTESGAIAGGTLGVFGIALIAFLVFRILK